MRVLVSGSTGLIGTALVDRLRADGHEAVRLTRTPKGTREREVIWHPSKGKIAREDLGVLDAAVHLAGENIFGWWTKDKKRRIRDSRVNGTALLAEALGSLRPHPKALVSASAIGYYGARGDEMLGETAEPGSTFLADVCRRWEDACEPARRAGIRVVCARFGVVLAPEGGALKMMLPVFKTGLGGPLGDGKQFMSWIAIEDAVGAVLFALERSEMSGPINVVAPQPATNREFTEVLARLLSRPAFLRVPKMAARAVLGAMADEMLLASGRAVPARLEAAGYRFRFPELEAALRAQLAKRR